MSDVAERPSDHQPPVPTPETLDLWAVYAAARQRADGSLSIQDGLAAAQAFYAFVEAVGDGAALATLIGKLVAADDPEARLLWRFASGSRRFAMRCPR